MFLQKIKGVLVLRDMLKYADEKKLKLSNHLSNFEQGDYRYLSMYDIDLRSFLDWLCECEELDTSKLFAGRISNLTKSYLYYVEQYKLHTSKFTN